MDPRQDKFGDERNGCCCRLDPASQSGATGEPVLSPEDIWLCVCRWCCLSPLGGGGGAVGINGPNPGMLVKALYLHGTW